MSWMRLVPLVLGTAAIFVLAGLLAWEDPSPGALAAAHAALFEDASLPGCESCHAAEGLTNGCLSCHVEIAAQLRGTQGWHGALPPDRREACGACHSEHNGEAYDLVGPPAWDGRDPAEFDHGHATFLLEGSHDALVCDACHAREGRAPFTLPAFPDRPREATFLGLEQACTSCHENAHAEERYATCTECHDQNAFRPASRFDHTPFFALRGDHAGAECGACHAAREDAATGIAFGAARGTTCAQCHESPHRAALDAACTSCHLADDPDWSPGTQRLTIAAHDASGFTLRAPHDRVACDACHRPAAGYEARFLLSAAAGGPMAEESCGQCHEDVHRGQFAGRFAGCLDCHERARFQPARFPRARHPEQPLQGAHADVDCNACHRADPETGVRAYAGVPTSCRACHEDVHRGQFGARDCDACHDQQRFLPSRYGLASHESFPILGAHRAVACMMCHRADAGPRRFAGTPQQCRACHTDPHGGQFAAELGKGDCTACHVADAGTFRIRPFDHAAASGYVLEDAHAAAGCASCHPAGARGVVRYRPTSTACASCHTDVHRGQFGARGAVRCERCHSSFAEWDVPGFDHNRQSRFALDGTHARVACAKCHLAVVQPDGARITQYKPLGTECRSCHDFDQR